MSLYGMAELGVAPRGPLCGCLLCDEPHPHPDHQDHRCRPASTRAGCAGCHNDRCSSHCWGPGPCACWRCR